MEAQKLFRRRILMAYLAKLGEYKFEMKKHQLEEIKRRFEYGFEEISRVAAAPVFHAKGGVREPLELSGTLWLQKQDALSGLEIIAAKKQPVPLVMGYGKVLGEYIIMELECTTSRLIENGAGLRQDFSAKLVKVEK